MRKRKTKGSVGEFDTNWKQRKEAVYSHWVKGTPQNQVQLAFRMHWLLFQELMGGQDYAQCLEVGCGRGSISSYFADNGFDCTLLDSSKSVLDTAQGISSENGHSARFVQGDALKLPFADKSFDVVVSIGLLEHFEEVSAPLLEQYRVLRPGGIFLGYIVPERPDNVQRYFTWINKILLLGSKIALGKKKRPVAKNEIYRSDYGAERYLPVIKKLEVSDLQVSGVYPLPMISHSPEFPFSLLPPFLEKVLTKIFMAALGLRKFFYKKNSWLCREEMGQAFLIVFKKSELWPPKVKLYQS